MAEFLGKAMEVSTLRVNLLRTRSVSYTFLSSELNIGHAV